MLAIVVVVRFAVRENGNCHTHDQQKRPECRFAIRFEKRPHALRLRSKDKNEREQGIRETFAEHVAEAAHHDGAHVAHVATQVGEGGHVRAKRTRREHREQTQEEGRKERKGGVMQYKIEHRNEKNAKYCYFF